MLKLDSQLFEKEITAHETNTKFESAFGKQPQFITHTHTPVHIIRALNPQ